MGLIYNNKSSRKGGLIYGNRDEETDLEGQLANRISNYETRIAATGREVPPPKKEKNLLLTALDVLDRPRNAVLSGLTGQGFTKGLTGQSKVHVSDLLKDKIKNPFLRGAAGFVGDVALDPLTYLTLGAAGAAKGAATQTALKFAGKPILNITPAASAVKKAFEGTKIPEALGPMFSNKYIRRAVTSADEMPEVEKARDVIMATQRAIPGRQQEALGSLKGVFKGLDSKSAEEAADILEAPLRIKPKAFTAKTTAKSTVKTTKGELPLTPLGQTANKVGSVSLDGATKVVPQIDEIKTLTLSGKALSKTGQNNLQTLFKQAEGGMEKLDSGLLKQTMSSLNKDGQNKLFASLKGATKTVPDLMVQGKETIMKFDKLPKAVVETKPKPTDMFKAAKEIGINLTPNNMAAAKVAKAVSEKTAKADIQAGVQFNELPNYIRHLYKEPPEKVQQILSDWVKRQANMPGKKAGFQKERAIPTIADAEKLGLTPIKDVRILTTVRELEGVKQRAMTSMYDEILKLGNVVMDADKAPVGWKQYVAIPQLKGKAVHPEIGRFLERFNSTINTDEGMRTFLNHVDSVQNFWKGLVTAPNPWFHVRNTIGNLFNNFLGGVVDPNTYVLANRIQKGGEEVVTLAGKRYTANQVRQMFREQGLEGFGFFMGESPRNMIRQATDAFVAKKTIGFNPIEGGRKVGDYIETNAKMAHFIDRLNKGDSIEQAAESVRKFLFDYGDLTQFEKTVRSFVPFYTFTRKNIPLQLAQLVANPGKMTAMNKLVQNLPQSEDMPEWMRFELAINIGNNTFIMPDLPMTQLNMLGSNVGRNALGMISPLAKVPIELAMGQQIFSGTPIEKYEGAQVPYGNMMLPAKLAYGLSQLGPLPRSAADIAGAINDQEPQQGNIPAAPDKIPFFSSVVRRVNPEREEILRMYDRERQLADLRRFIEEVKGEEVPTIAELQPSSKKKKGLIY